MGVNVRAAGATATAGGGAGARWRDGSGAGGDATARREEQRGAGHIRLLMHQVRPCHLRLPEAMPRRHTKPIATSHSSSDETWITHVGRESAFAGSAKPRVHKSSGLQYAREGRVCVCGQPCEQSEEEDGSAGTGHAC